jgi:5-methyltetrahydropteroyltriglutamate--homocysteine methyltransferase
MGSRDIPPFRADHVGSLLRPASLQQARTEFSAGAIDEDELRAVEDAAIRDAVALQQGLGLQSITDGEFRRKFWHLDFVERLEGIGYNGPAMNSHFRNEEGEMPFASPGLAAIGKIGLKAGDSPIFGEHFSFLQSIVDSGHAKMTIPSPNMVDYRSAPPANWVYPDLEQYWADISTAYQQQLRGLADLGCRYLQLDDTTLAYLNDPRERERQADLGKDASNLHRRYIRQVNAAVSGRPDDMTITVHMCRGNFRSSWVAEGGYDFVAEELFGELDVDGYFMEFDSERAGTFAPLRFVPAGKRVVLGLVTTKTPELESKDDIKRRIDEAAKYVPLEQLCLSPQCGFSSTVEGNILTVEDEAAKLRLVVETAAEVWG